MSETERIEDIALEIDYWIGVLHDTEGVNDGTAMVAGELSNLTVTLLTLLTAPHTERLDLIGDGMEAVTRCLRRLRDMQPHIRGIADYAKGRHAVLQRELEAITNGGDV